MLGRSGVGFGDIRIQQLNSAEPEVPGKILNISGGALHAQVSHYLPAGSVRVWFSRDCHSDGQIIFCRSEAESFCAGILFPPNSADRRRSELRVPLTNQAAILTQLDVDHPAKRDAQAVDISRSGMGLLIDQPLAAGAWVRVELSFAILFGEVLYSRAHAPDGYRVGLRIETLLMRDGRLGEAPELIYRTPSIVT